MNNHINASHKRTLSFSIQQLVIKFFMASEILTEKFPQKESINSHRNRTTLQIRNIKTVMYGTENIFNWGTKNIGYFTNGIEKKLYLVHYQNENSLLGTR